LFASVILWDKSMSMGKFGLITSLAAVLIATLQSSFAQSTFQNLDFEQAVVVPAAPTCISAQGYPIDGASALPYWNDGYWTQSCGEIYGNASYPLDEASIALVWALNPFIAAIDGSYSVQLTAYAGSGGGAISQTGLIPAGTHSIQFLVANSYHNDIPANPTVSLNGTPISLFTLSQSGGLRTMEGDVSAFAGTTATLAIYAVAQGTTFPANENGFMLDDIQFSPSTVPEPGVLTLAGLGIVLLSLRRLSGLRRPDQANPGR
jgi:hypothetical protein